MIKIEADTRGITELQSAMKKIPGNIKQLSRKASRSALTAMKNAAKSEVLAQYEIKPRPVNKAMKTKVTPGGGMLLVRGRRMNVSDFKISPRRVKNPQHGLSVSVKRSTGMKRIPRGFLIRGRNSGKILGMERIGSKREDIKALTTLAIPQMMNDPEVQQKVKEAGNEALMSVLREWSVIRR